MFGGVDLGAIRLPRQIHHGMLITHFGHSMKGRQGSDFVRLASLRGEVDVHEGALTPATDGLSGVASGVHPIRSSAGLDDLHLFDRALGVLAKECQWYFFHG